MNITTYTKELLFKIGFRINILKLRISNKIFT